MTTLTYQQQKTEEKIRCSTNVKSNIDIYLYYISFHLFNKWYRKISIKVLIQCILQDCAKQCAKNGKLKEMSRCISIRKRSAINFSLCNSININDIILRKYKDCVLRFQTKTNQI